MSKKPIVISIIGIIVIIIFFQRNWRSQKIINLKNARIEIMCNPKIIALNKLNSKKSKNNKNKEYITAKLEAINEKKAILKKYGFASITEYGIIYRKNLKNKKLNR